MGNGGSRGYLQVKSWSRAGKKSRIHWNDSEAAPSTKLCDVLLGTLLKLLGHALRYWLLYQLTRWGRNIRTESKYESKHLRSAMLNRYHSNIPTFRPFNLILIDNYDSFSRAAKLPSRPSLAIKLTLTIETSIERRARVISRPGLLANKIYFKIIYATIEIPIPRLAGIQIRRILAGPFVKFEIIPELSYISTLGHYIEKEIQLDADLAAEFIGVVENGRQVPTGSLSDLHVGARNCNRTRTHVAP